MIFECLLHRAHPAYGEGGEGEGGGVDAGVLSVHVEGTTKRAPHPSAMLTICFIDCGKNTFYLWGKILLVPTTLNTVKIRAKSIQ